MRKFQLMQHFPEVRDDNACESWINELVSQELKDDFSMTVPRAGDFAA